MNVLAVFQALADPTRLALFQCIRGCGGESAYDCETGQCDATDAGAVALCEVKCQVPCSPSTLTHHLNVLREAGLVSYERRGRQVYVRIRRQAMDQARTFFSEPK